MKIEKIVVPVVAFIMLAGGCGAKEKQVSKIEKTENKAGVKMSQDNKTQEHKTFRCFRI